MTYTLTNLRKVNSVQATRTVLGLTKTERNEYIKDALKQLEAQGAKNPRVSNNSIICDNSSQIFFLPRLAESMGGTLVFRSKDMVFKPSDGGEWIYYTPKASDIKDSVITAYDYKGKAVATYKLGVK